MCTKCAHDDCLGCGGFLASGTVGSEVAEQVETRPQPRTPAAVTVYLSDCGDPGDCSE